MARLATAWLASAGLVSCSSVAVTGDGGGQRLTARPPSPEIEPPPPGPEVGEQWAPGLHSLDVGSPRQALLFIPSSYRAEQPAPLVVMLHGAGGDPQGGLDPLLRLSDDNGLILLAPGSAGPTWDVVMGGYGPDVRAIDRALQQVFARSRVDRSRVAVEGFSDGASYALSLGLANGDLFTHVIAFSPGFVASGAREGKPRVFMTHGVHDTVLPIDSTSRRINRDLTQGGYDLTYREFDGPHAVPPELADEAVAWFVHADPAPAG